MKSHIAMLGMLGAIMSGVNSVPSGEDEIDIKKPSPEDISRKREEYLKRKGVNKFIINGEPIFARDYKNALRKSKNKTS